MTDAELLATLAPSKADAAAAPKSDPTVATEAVADDERARDFRVVAFRETDYRTGCVTSREVEAPVINRFSDHVLVRLPDGSSLRVQEKRR